MKTTKLLPILVLLFTPFLMQAQDFIGAWTISGTTPQRKPVTNTITFNADKTKTVDFGSDGKVDVRSTFTVNGKQVSVSNTGQEGGCYGKVGVYNVTVAGDILTATLVNDPCEARRADVMEMKRK